MKVISNNCVSEIKVPERLGKAYSVDYNPALGLYATADLENGVAVWDPESRKVIAIFEHVNELYYPLFLPGDRLAVSYHRLFIEGAVDIYTFDKKKSKPAKFTIKRSPGLPISSPRALALSPNNTLLLANQDVRSWSDGVYELVMDWNDLKVIKSEEIHLSNTDEKIKEDIIGLCCSPDFKVATYNLNFNSGLGLIRIAKVCFNSDGKIKEEEQETITYYMLDGERRNLSMDWDQVGYEEEEQQDPLEDGDMDGVSYDWGYRGLVHDGEHLIIANRDEIVLLESMTEGSNAHLIASNLTSSERQLRINLDGQLMVCEDTVIKLFEYKCHPRTLQALCRHKIRKTIRTDYREKVNNFEIPTTLKDYLLYK